MYVLKGLHKHFHHDGRVEIALVSERNYFLFTPLLHEVATGGVNPEHIVEPIRKILGCCLSGLWLGKAEIIRLRERRVEVAGRVLDYDYLILATGAQTNFYGIPGASEHSFPLKSLEEAVRFKNHCIAQIERAAHTTDRAQRKRMLCFVVAGGGPTGVELAAELKEFLTDTFSRYYPPDVIEDVSVTLIQKGSELLQQFDPRLRKKSIEVLRRKGITVMTDTEIAEVGPSHITLHPGGVLETETVAWVAGVKPAEIAFDEPISRSADGRLMVNEYLQLEGHPEIFVLGDAAASRREDSASYLPALAQVAVSEARSVSANIKRLVEGARPEPFRYRHKGDLVSLGQWMAIGEIARFAFWGHVAWLLWRTVYLSKLISWRKKVKVAVDWTINFFSPRDMSQL